MAAGSACFLNGLCQALWGRAWCQCGPHRWLLWRTRAERRASDKCQREKRKTINGDDLLWAMTTLGFEDYVEPLKVYLQKFRQAEAEVRRGERRWGRCGGRLWPPVQLQKCRL